MPQRPRKVRFILLLLCASGAIALAALWWRSGATIDTLAWTLERLDPAVAARNLPLTWSSPQASYSHAVRTFSVRSDNGHIRFESATYLKREEEAFIRLSRASHQLSPPPPEPISPYPFRDEPGLSCSYGTMVYSPPHPFRVGWLSTTNVAAGMLGQSGWPARDWVYQSRSVSIPHWALIVVLLLPGILAFIGHVRRLRRARDGFCRTCGYDIRASPDRCPECGTAVAGVAAPAR